MTREEAIEQIKWYFEEDDGISAEDITKEAVYMAIEALKAEAVRGVGRYENAIQKLRELPRYINGVKVRRIEKMPTKADTVEVVRCKDCKHAYYADNRVPHERTWVCERFTNEEINANDFCSFGERSEE